MVFILYYNICRGWRKFSPIASLSSPSSFFFQIIISMTRLSSYQGFRGRQRRKAFYFLGVGAGALKYLKGNGEQATSFFWGGGEGEGSCGKHFPELKPFVFQGAGSFVGIPACVKAIASRKPSLIVL